MSDTTNDRQPSAADHSLRNFFVGVIAVSVVVIVILGYVDGAFG